MRSDDGGATWKKVFAGAVHHVAVDGAHADRLAAGTADGIVLSADGGATWQMQDRKLPYRVYDLVCFAGDRLLAGSGGSGAFWMSLSPAGEQPVLARPAVPVPAPAKGGSVALPELANLHMNAGGGTPTGWRLWTGEGKLSISRDITTFVDPPASLKLETQSAGAYGSASQGFKAVSSPFTIAGAVKTSGPVAECLVAVQVFDAAGKQIDWVQLADAREAHDWQHFSREVQFPPAAEHCSLVLTLRGGTAADPARAWLDALSIGAAPRVFPD